MHYPKFHTGKKLHVGSLGALYKQRWQQQQAIVVRVTDVSKDHGHVWKLGWGERKMGAELNIVIREKEEGNVCCFTFLPVSASLL